MTFDPVLGGHARFLTEFNLLILSEDLLLSLGKKMIEENNNMIFNNQIIHQK